MGIEATRGAVLDQATKPETTRSLFNKFGRLGALAFVGIGGFLAVPGTASAAPGDNGRGNGGCVDNLYGNATNERPSGNGVLPSQSPGPFVNTGFNEPPRNDRVNGLSVGEVMQITTGLGLNGKQTMDIICTFP